MLVILIIKRYVAINTNVEFSMDSHERSAWHTGRQQSPVVKCVRWSQGGSDQISNLLPIDCEFRQVLNLTWLNIICILQIKKLTHRTVLRMKQWVVVYKTGLARSMGNRNICWIRKYIEKWKNKICRIMYNLTKKYTRGSMHSTSW